MHDLRPLDDQFPCLPFVVFLLAGFQVHYPDICVRQRNADTAGRSAVLKGDIVSVESRSNEIWTVNSCVDQKVGERDLRIFQ